MQYGGRRQTSLVQPQLRRPSKGNRKQTNPSAMAEQVFRMGLNQAKNGCHRSIPQHLGNHFCHRNQASRSLMSRTKYLTYAADAGLSNHNR